MKDAPTIADVIDRLDALLNRTAAGPSPRFLGIEDAAAHCSLSAKSIRRLIARRELEPLRPVRGKVLIDRQQLDALVLSATNRVRSGRGIR